MAEKRRFYRVTFRDFSGRPIIKYWREDSEGAVRQKARGQADCCRIETVIELTAEQYAAHAPTPPRAKRQLIRNHS